MRDITINEIDSIKNNSKSVVLIWAEGCEACNLAKPLYDQIESKYDQFYFYRLQLSPDILDFYKQYIPKESTMIQSKDAEGNLLFDTESKPVMEWKVDDNGQIIQESPLSFPNFLVFVNGFIDENNEHGFVGNVAGLNIGHLEYALTAMSEQKVG